MINLEDILVRHQLYTYPEEEIVRILKDALERLGLVVPEPTTLDTIKTVIASIESMHHTDYLYEFIKAAMDVGITCNYTTVTEGGIEAL